MVDLSSILTETENLLIQHKASFEEATLELCQYLQKKYPDRYDWVGFYWVSGEKMLRLGSFVGKPTDHQFIPFGKGICGQVAESEKTMIVDDVTKEDNYIACSIDVKSEIVVPIMKDGQFIGQIDIDSHVPSAFSETDRQLLEEICSQISAHLFN